MLWRLRPKGQLPLKVLPKVDGSVVGMVSSTKGSESGLGPGNPSPLLRTLIGLILLFRRGNEIPKNSNSLVPSR